MDNPEPASFKPIRSRRLFEEISSQVRDQIASGSLRPGDKLPPERALALQFGVSRTAVREALRSLEFAGLVRQQHGVNGGSFILGAETGLVHSFESMVSVGRLSLAELTEVRVEILDVVTRLAARNHHASHIKALEKDVKRTEAALAINEIVADPSLTQNFYTLLADATGNRLLVAFVKSLSQFLYQAIDEPYPVDFDLIDIRTRFLQKLKVRDEQGACTIMRNYLVYLHGYIMEKQS